MLDRIDYAAEAMNLITRREEFAQGDAAAISADLAGLAYAVLALAGGKETT